MSESITYMQQLHIPQHIAPMAYDTVLALVGQECDGGDGEFDEPANTALKALLHVRIIEWDCLNVTIDKLVKCIVLEDVRIFLPNVEGEREAHLVRYLVNIAKRTGQEWKVLKRYTTGGFGYDTLYHRALLRAEDGSTLRIYYRVHSRCWVKGQRVLATTEVYLMEKYSGGMT